MSLGAGCALIAGLTSHELYPPDGIVQITAGVDHACALTRGGKVWCWGANDTGQLGRNAVVDGGACTTACPPVEVDGLSGAVQISAGAGFTCAVQTSGKVECWGRDDTGQLGRVTTVTCKGGACDPVPDVAEGVIGAVQVSAGGGYACARAGDGGVVCWGADTYGELGTGVLAAQSVPRPVPGIGAAVDVSAALVGSNTCIAASDGGVSCWGLDSSGGVGHAPDAGNVKASDGNPCSPEPAPVEGVGSAVAVITGDYGACAQTDPSGFSCWGYDGIGSLGTGDAGAVVELPPGTV
jgi:alpha-tubulin suppressor-like RCC1 family protein